MAIFCIIVFWGKILLVIETLVNLPAIIYNNFILPFRLVGDSIPYFHFSKSDD